MTKSGKHVIPFHVCDENERRNMASFGQYCWVLCFFWKSFSAQPQEQGQGSTLLSPWGNVFVAQCIVAFHNIQRVQQNKNRQTNILTLTTWSLIFYTLNCALLYCIETYSMGIKYKCYIILCCILPYCTTLEIQCSHESTI